MGNARVVFLMHETIEASDPAKRWELGKRLRRWIVRRVSPRFGHCSIEIGLGPLASWSECTYEGYRSGMGRLEADAALVTDDHRHPQIPDKSGRPRLHGLKMVLAYFFPRRFDNCASYVGKMVGFDAATPDQLYWSMIQFKTADLFDDKGARDGKDA